MKARKTLSSASVEKMASELPIFRRHLEAGYSIGMAARLTGWSIAARMELRKYNEEMDELCEKYQKRRFRGMTVAKQTAIFSFAFWLVQAWAGWG